MTDKHPPGPPGKNTPPARRRASPWFDGAGAWLLHQYMGYVWAFVIAAVVVVPLVLLGVLDSAFLALPGGLAFPAAVTLGIAFLRHRLGGRKP
jgi:hypothetical protein